MTTVKTPTRVALQNILVATDFSRCAESALQHAIALAHRYGSKLYTVTVLPHTPFVEASDTDPEELRRTAENKLRKLATSEVFPGIQHEELIEEGEAARVLSDIVQEHHIDLMVLGTEGRTGIEKFLLGSVAEEIFRTATCPVLTVGPHVVRGPTAGQMQHILYATDFGVESIHALPYGLSLAEEHRAQLTLLHVAQDRGVELVPQPGAMPVMTPYEEVETGEKRLHELIPRDNLLCHEPDFVVQFGETVDTILRIARRDASLIVLGVKRAGVLAKHLGGSVAYRVVCEAPCPVLSVSGQTHN
jgi:nucleotide-binding universal stress UspA family protein